MTGHDRREEKEPGRQSPRDEPEDLGEESLLNSGFEGPAGQGQILPTPSQAEGERDKIDQDSEEAGQSGGQYAASTGLSPEDVLHTPSQAEGSRETVERDLEEKFGDKGDRPTDR